MRTKCRPLEKSVQELLAQAVDMELVEVTLPIPDEIDINEVDFSGVSDTFGSAPLARARIKSPSRVLPSEYEYTRHEAFHSGASRATGRAAFYDLIHKFKAALGRVPFKEGGKLHELTNVIRNDARKLNRHIYKLDAQLTRVLRSDSLDDNARREAALHATFFLDTCHDWLSEVLDELKTYAGLAKANAQISYGNYIVSGKPSKAERPSFLIKRESEHRAEMSMLVEVASKREALKTALLRLQGIGICEADYKEWKEHNAVRLKVMLNTYKGAGYMTGAAIQGLITAAINFGLGAATMNPIVFAAGAYYATSAGVRVVETAIKTGIENRLIRDEAQRVDTSRRVAGLRNLETVDTLHVMVDGLANSAFETACTLHNPLTSGVPGKIREVNIGAHNEYKRMKRDAK